jgi:polyhydroxyalkanoate synthase
MAMKMGNDKITSDYTVTFDREFHSALGKLWPISPASIGGAYFDWMTHLLISPGKQAELWGLGLQNWASLYSYALGIKTDSGLMGDRRFQDENWQSWPFSLYAKSFLLSEDWWNHATHSIRGVSHHHAEVLPFMTRQILDMVSPVNFPTTNPQVVRATIEYKGVNLLRGFRNWIVDANRVLKKERPQGMDKFKVGKNLACTKGKVIYQNQLIELIQYSPVTKDVYKEPILIVPAWIMKYYILDLSPQNSLVKYLVDNHHTVFMISWKNPDSKDRDLGFDDYVQLGIMEAIEAISAIVPGTKIQAVGYCLGGTLLTIAAATMARERDDRLKSLTFFATQVDFEDAGELLLFIDESEITFLEDVMWDKGYLDASRMAGTFNMLRSYDLVWSRGVERYLLGKRLVATDLMAWNADATRMPYKMHSQYLRELFLSNRLTDGTFKVKGRPIALNDIDIPLFSVATRKDHISPWKSVFKIHLFVDSEITFVLTTGGHNVGIVSEPGHPHRSYQISTHRSTDLHPSPDSWMESTPHHRGSWWPAWKRWLKANSSSKTKPPSMGAPGKGYKILREAPGKYVMEK